MGQEKKRVEACDFSEIKKLVSNLGSKSEISPWLGSEYPCMNLLVKGEKAHLCYFPSLNHPGYISQNEQDDEGSFLINQEDDIEVPINSLITVDSALRAAKEFSETTNLPKHPKWLEL